LRNEAIQSKPKENYDRNLSSAASNVSTKFKKKQEETFLKKYGVKHPLQNEEVRAKCLATNLERYGVEHPQQNEEVRAKGVVTILKDMV
jgi:hypothetical protein